MSAPRLTGVVLAGLVLAAGAPAGAQRAITGARTTIDFTGYAGGGLAPAPAVGQLDSDDWRISGIGADTAFGGTHTDGAFALGEAPGGVAAGGLYAFFVAMNDPAFGWQMATNELTPGAFTVRFVNQTGAPIVDPTLRYELWIRNDSGRSAIVTFAWSLDDAAYTDVPGLAETTTVAADAPAAWVRVPKEIALTGTTIPADGLIYLRWSCDDVAGTGGRDELALDDIEVLIPGCGDGVVQPGEGCDDGGAADGDGCSAACTPEHGYACDGEPSVCASTCGDGLVASDEGCDDGDTDAGDGCDDLCAVEDGYVCLGEPSVCGNSCGDGVIDPSEACDDGNTDAGDGCSDTCGVEGGWTCGGAPSTCLADRDGDGVPDDEDNCVDVINPSQADLDDDGLGNACDDASEAPDDGGCCAVDDRGGGRAGGWILLGLAVAGVLRRRRRSRA